MDTDQIKAAVKEMASQVADDSVESALQMCETLAMCEIEAEPAQIWNKDDLSFAVVIPVTSFHKVKEIIAAAIID